MPQAGSTTARSGGGVHIDGLRELLAGLRRLSRDAPAIFHRELAVHVEAAVLPEIKARTPVGDTGALRDASRFALYKGDTAAFENPLPYANAIHWGRNYWPNAVGGKDRRRPVPSVITPTEFMYGPVVEHIDDIVEAIADGFTAALQKATS